MGDGIDPVVRRLHATNDAKVWAEEFVRIVKGGADPTDEGFMIGWFSNAMGVAERFALAEAPADGGGEGGEAMSGQPEHLQADRSQRGFDAMPQIPGNYGGSAIVWESSGAEEPKLWLKVTEPNDLNAWAHGDESGGTHEATLHLTAEDAWKLADQLCYLVEHHYQGDARPDWADGWRMDAATGAARGDTAGSYYDGCRDALSWYAWYKDGTQYVVAGLRTLKEAMADVAAAEAAGRPYGAAGAE